jgi:hypothetical protein
MPLEMAHEAPTMLVRREAFERAGIMREAIDRALNLTPDEFRVEGALIAVGPLVGEDGIERLIELLEGAGLEHYADFFDLSGSWPDWLRLFAMATRTEGAPASPPG